MKKNTAIFINMSLSVVVCRSHSWPLGFWVLSVFKLEGLQGQTKQQKRQFFLPKIIKVFLSPISQNLKGSSVLDKTFFEIYYENDPLDEPKGLPLQLNPSLTL